MSESGSSVCAFPTGRHCVYLVGAGPGDPGLLTVKAICLINRADVVVYDRLVSDEIMDLVPSGVFRVFVGKKSGCHAKSQDEINEILVRLGKSRRTVVRLKGGDPFLFGRGGEEAEYLVQHGVDFEVIPGVTAATACAAYAGIPVTHRDHAHGVVIETGHGYNGTSAEQRIVNTYQANRKSTMIIYMGLGRLQNIFDSLIDGGMPSDMPVALIEHGTTASQRRVLTTAQSAHIDSISAGLESPTLIVIGSVVRLATILDWFIPADSIPVENISVNENL